jgi:hypothetical protein
MEAKALGLIDEVGTIESVVSGSAMGKTHHFGPDEDDLGGLGGKLAAEVFSAWSDLSATPVLRLRSLAIELR